jgi:hypothetical protein
MQLTKDDVWEKEDLSLSGIQTGKTNKYLNFSKFRKVLDFYEKYKESITKVGDGYIRFTEKYDTIIDLPVDDDTTETEFQLMWQDWLFNYCFKDGLK